jgi:hypothetical protein
LRHIPGINLVVIPIPVISSRLKINQISYGNDNAIILVPGVDTNTCSRQARMHMRMKLGKYHAAKHT